ncbi:MAG: sigma-70 family RNA polymerase sigma factor [Candidatus Binatia bacterium]
MRKVPEGWLHFPGAGNFAPDPLASSRNQREQTASPVSENKVLDVLFRGKKALTEEFERVAIPHLAYIYTAAFYLTKNEQEAEDLAQDTYVRAFRFFRKFEPGTNCRAWLLSIQRHLFINRYQKRKKQPELIDWAKIDREYESLVLDEEHTARYNPERLLCVDAMAPEVEKALKTLPEEFRIAVILVNIDELTYEETAKVIDCPLGTVRSRLSRGRRMLQVALRDYAREKGLEKKKP